MLKVLDYFDLCIGLIMRKPVLWVCDSVKLQLRRVASLAIILFQRENNKGTAQTAQMHG